MGTEELIWAWGEGEIGGGGHGENHGGKKRDLFAGSSRYNGKIDAGEGLEGEELAQEFDGDQQFLGQAFDDDWSEDEGEWDEENGQLAFGQEDDDQEWGQSAASEDEEEEGDWEDYDDDDDVPYSTGEEEQEEDGQSVQSAAGMQSATAESVSSGSSSSNSTSIIAAVLSIFVLAAVGLAGFLVYRRRRSRFHSKVSGEMMQDGKGGDLKLGKMVVTHAYVSTLPDEIDLRVGDVVVVSAKYDDGWSKGLNESTGKRGSFPYVCLDGGLVKGSEEKV